MPAMLPAAAASTALGTGVAVGAFGAGIGSAALGTGLAAGTALAGGTGIAGLLGGLGGAGAVAPGAFGALAPAVATKLAPAAAAQAAGTIGTAAGSVAPGAFGANLAGAAAPGLTGTVGGVAPGAFGANLAGAGQGLAGAANPTLAQQIAAAQNQANLTRQAMGAKDIIGGAAQKAADPIGTTYGTQVIDGRVVRSSLPPFDAPVVSTPNVATNAIQNANPSGFSDAGFRGLNRNYQSALNPGANTVSETGQLIADPRSEILGRGIRPNQNFLQNLGNIGSFQDVKDYAEQHPYATTAMAGLGAMGLKDMFKQEGVKEPESKAMIRPYTYDRSQRPEAYAVSPGMDSSERNYFNSQFIAGEPYKAAEGGLTALAVGGPVEQMAAMNSVGTNTGYPMANLQTPVYSNPAMQRPEATNVIAPSGDVGVGAYTGEPRFAKGGEAKAEGGYKYSYDPTTMQFTQLSTPVIDVGRGLQPVNNPGTKVSGGISNPAMPSVQAQQVVPINIPSYQTPEQQLGLTGFYDRMSQPQLGLSDLSGFYHTMNQKLAGYAGYAGGGNVGGISHLGDYSDGGRLLKGPGDGVSDSIPASIGNRQPARLADGEFVVPARIVSELGNGSTEAGARKLYAMMERVQKSRKKSIGKKKVAVNSKADKHLPA
jgi:hypothetical protein